MKPINTLLIVLVCISLLLCGCHYILQVQLFNNTGQNVTIVSFDARTNASTDFVRAGDNVGLGIPSKLEIANRTHGTWHYDLKRVPMEFHKQVGWNRHLLRFQIQEDGAIYVLSPGTSGPVTNFPPQPIGYPLRPKLPQ